MRLMTILLTLSVLGASGCAESGQPARNNRTQQALAESMPPGHLFQRHMIDLNGLTLSVLEAGSGDPIIFVHGVVTTSNIFPQYVSAFSPDFRGIACLLYTSDAADE